MINEVQPMLFSDMPDEPHRPGSGDAAASARLLEAAKADMVRVAPGVHVWRPRDAARVPETALCRWAQVQGGYAPVPIAGRYVRLTAPVAARLGFRNAEKDHRYDTLLRLGRAGFVDIAHVSPGCYMIDIDSWHRHLADVLDDEGYWDEGRGNIEKYFDANGLGGWKRRNRRAAL